jgi:hypothetical protein
VPDESVSRKSGVSEKDMAGRYQAKIRQNPRLKRTKYRLFVILDSLRAAKKTATIIRVRQPGETEPVSQFGVFARPIFADTKIGVTKISQRPIY